MASVLHLVCLFVCVCVFETGSYSAPKLTWSSLVINTAVFLHQPPRALGLQCEPSAWLLDLKEAEAVQLRYFSHMTSPKRFHHP